jgi:hypothetical protein
MTALLLLFPLVLPAQSDRIITTEDQSFSAAGIGDAQIIAGAGSLSIVGRRESETIEVQADFRGKFNSQEEAQRILDNLMLTAELRGSTFFLKTEQKRSWSWRNSGRIDVVLSLPAHIHLDIEDSSGSMEVSGFDSNLTIEDGSGSIKVDSVRGDITIDDGSGEIWVRDVDGDVVIEDGSGQIDVAHIGGTVKIKDGSGSIDVEDVQVDFVVTRDGSGSIRHRDVRGRVDIPRKK